MTIVGFSGRTAERPVEEVSAVTRNYVIGNFLKARRAQLVRAELGLSPVGHRAYGLRREEVAYLAGVSVTWYTWLEQGRDIQPSRQVLDALARTLQLSAAEHSYLLLLAGYSDPRSATVPTPQAVPVHIRRMLEAFTDFPAYAIAADWQILAWNATYAGLYPNVATVPESDKNLLWLLFTDPYLRGLLPDWELTTRYHVAAFRAEAGPRLVCPPFSDLVERLLEASELFGSIWESHSIEFLSSRKRLFCHPVVGDIHVEQHSLTPSDHPGLHVVVYVPDPTTDTLARLRRLSNANVRENR